jgi:hypothetical protein
MPDNAPQSFSNHTRLDPPFHFFALPVLGITVLLAIWNAIRDFSFQSAWMIVVALALLVVAVKARAYPLKAQDRVIRLEERLRLSSLLSEPLRSRIGELTEGQLIALRFASDAEVPGLVEKTLSGKLEPADIKKAIVTWRPDNLRM